MGVEGRGRPGCWGWFQVLREAEGMLDPSKISKPSDMSQPPYTAPTKSALENDPADFLFIQPLKE